VQLSGDEDARRKEAGRVWYGLLVGAMGCGKVQVWKVQEARREDGFCVFSFAEGHMQQKENKRQK
jgi:hypothetical protein